MTITDICHNPLVAYSRLIEGDLIKEKCYGGAYIRAYRKHKCGMKARKFALIELRQKKII
jgi:hypothetical protein